MKDKSGYFNAWFSEHAWSGMCRCIVPECGYVCLNDDSMQIHVMSKHANLYDDKKHAIVVYTAAPATANTNPGFN